MRISSGKCWRGCSLGEHNADIKKRAIVSKEVRKAVKFGLKAFPPEDHEKMFDAIAELFLSRVGGMDEEILTEKFYANLLSSITPVKKT